MYSEMPPCVFVFAILVERVRFMILPDSADESILAPNQVLNLLIKCCRWCFPLGNIHVTEQQDQSALRYEEILRAHRWSSVGTGLYKRSALRLIHLGGH